MVNKIICNETIHKKNKVKGQINQSNTLMGENKGRLLPALLQFLIAPHRIGNSSFCPLDFL